MEDLAIYLRLTPEFGGTRFGPFEQLETRLGSDDERCHIVLPESLGVLPVHAQVLRQGNNNTIVAPADRAATLFLWREGQRRPDQITSPTALRAGDGFSLVTADGPRFIIEIDVLPPEIQEERARAKRKGTHGRDRLTKETMGAEVKRQAWTEILTQAPAQMAQRAWTFIVSGAIYQPRNIIMGVVLLSGWIMGGWMLCSRGEQEDIAASWQSKSGECEVRFEQANDRADQCERYRDTPFEEMNFHGLAIDITKSDRLGTTLRTDSPLKQAVVAEAQLIKKEDYDWLLSAQGSAYQNFKAWRNSVYASEQLNDDSKLLLTWLGARRALGRAEWQTINDRNGNPICARGPLLLTDTMSEHLGMAFQVSALYTGPDEDIAEGRDLVLFMEEVYKERSLEVPEELQVDKAKVDQGFCVFVVGEDDRASSRALVAQLNRFLGNNSKLVPDADANTAATARVAKYWSTHFTWGNYANQQGIEFKTTDKVSSVLGRQEATGDWVIKQTARTIAQSIMLPCFIELHSEESDKDKLFGPIDDGIKRPTTLSCVYLQVKLPEF